MQTNKDWNGKQDRTMNSKSCNRSESPDLIPCYSFNFLVRRIIFWKKEAQRTFEHTTKKECQPSTAPSWRLQDTRQCSRLISSVSYWPSCLHVMLLAWEYASFCFFEKSGSFSSKKWFLTIKFAKKSFKLSDQRRKKN